MYFLKYVFWIILNPQKATDCIFKEHFKWRRLPSSSKRCSTTWLYAQRHYFLNFSQLLVSLGKLINGLYTRRYFW